MKSKSKLSLRKKVMIEIISPTVITSTMGIIKIREQDSMLTNIIMLLAILFYLFMLFNTYNKNVEQEDEMSRRNQQKADSLSFNIMLTIVACILVYTIVIKTSLELSMSLVLATFVGMNILNLAIFLYFDIRGN